MLVDVKPEILESTRLVSSSEGADYTMQQHPILVVSVVFVPER